MSAHSSWVAIGPSSWSGISIARSSARRWPTSTIAHLALSLERLDALAGRRPRADQQARHLFDGALRGGEADALEAPPRERVQALEREGQVRAALVGGDGVDLVDDDGL